MNFHFNNSNIGNVKDYDPQNKLGQGWDFYAMRRKYNINPFSNNNSNAIVNQDSNNNYSISEIRGYPKANDSKKYVINQPDFSNPITVGNNINNVKWFNEINEVIEGKKKKQHSNSNVNDFSVGNKQNMNFNMNYITKPNEGSYQKYNTIEHYSGGGNNANSINSLLVKKNIPRNPFSKIQNTSIPKNITIENINTSSSNKAIQSYEHGNISNNIKTLNLTHEYNFQANCVKQYSYHENKNSLHRKEMEDFHVILDNFNSIPREGLFLLWDGHGGKSVASFAQENYPNIFIKSLNTIHNIEKSFHASLQELDRQLQSLSNIDNCGSTFTCIYMTNELSYNNNKRVFYSANLGDSKALWIKKDKHVKWITTTHKCSNEDEAKRIRDLGGIVFNGRLFGQLALSRALGDFSMKQHGLVVTPSIYKHIIENQDLYIIAASDGVWDAVTESEIWSICYNGKNCDEIGKHIIEWAMKKGSQDNISCITIQL